MTPRLWIASPYSDSPPERVRAIRDWLQKTFSKVKTPVMPISPVAATGDWGASCFDENTWYYMLGSWLRHGNFDAMIVVQNLFGEDDYQHEESTGINIERKIAQEENIPIHEISAQDARAHQHIEALAESLTSSNPFYQHPTGRLALP